MDLSTFGLKQDDINSWIDLGMAFAVDLAVALAIFIVGKVIAKLITGLTRKALRRTKADEMLVGFVGNIVYGVLIALVMIAAISHLGVETTSLAAVIAAAGLAIGLALQGSLSNFASGVMIIAFRPFKTGDFVEAAGVSGSVKEISLFNTIILTGDNKTVIVPNGNVIGNSIINYSSQKTRRVDMVFGIGYDDDIKKAKAVLTEIVTKDKRVLKDPAPTVAVSELGDSSVNFVVRPWVATADYWAVYFDTHEAVKERFDAEGISIPFPQRDVHVHAVAHSQAAKVGVPRKPATKKPAAKKPAAKKKAA